MPKSVTGKIWNSVLGKIFLMAVVFGFFYIIGDGFHIIPQAAKDFVTFLADNFQLLVFALCFTTGAYLLIVIFQSRNKRGGPSS